MKKLSTNPETVQKRNSQKKEMEEKHQEHLKCGHERKCLRNEAETEKKHDVQLVRQRENRLQRKAKETAKERIKRLKIKRKKK